MLLCLDGDDDPIGNDIIDVGRAHRSGKPEIIDLDGCGSKRKHVRPFGTEIAVQADEDVDFQFSYCASDFAIGSARHVVKCVERLFQASPHRALVLWSHRKAVDLEFLPIMGFEEIRRQIGRSLFAEFTGHVANADPFVLVLLSAPDRWLQRVFVLGKHSCAAQLRRRGRAAGEQNKRRRRKSAGLYVALEPRDFRGQVRPVTELHFRVQAPALDIG